MAITQQRQDPSQLIGQLGQDYATQLTGLTSVPLDTSKFAPSVAAQDPLQTQAASLAQSGVGGYAPYLSEAATYGTQAGTTMGGVSPYITGAAGLTGTGAGTGAGSIASYMSPYQSQVIDATLSEFDKQAAMRQQQTQREKDAAAQAAQLAAFEPYQRLGTYGQGIGMLAPMMGGTQTAITPDPTALQTALGWTSVLGGIMNPQIG